MRLSRSRKLRNADIAGMRTGAGCSSQAPSAGADPAHRRGMRRSGAGSSDCLGDTVDDVDDPGRGFSRGRRVTRYCPALKHLLQERCGLREPACAGKAGCLEHTS